ncbi:formylglycine-generating enzyme family protein [Metabacillus idriensis]|nr:formylglycine-generating enzyme family protein [Metabacillus idriensis]MCM3596147.1 formylglycine-generating enzyme family protein [Metabacillus idriensis]OHR69530.1 serine/threonine protein phosphatase [Bacillus sp. HMSC76G11]
MKKCCTPERFQNQRLGTKLNVLNKSKICFKEGMVLLDGGSFIMGSDSKEGFSKDGEGPAREVILSPFYIDIYAVTNKQFKQFVHETGYITAAELYGWSFVFDQFLSEEALAAKPERVPGLPWWAAVYGASWKQPEGPGSFIENRLDHPAVHVSWKDAQSYCIWAGKRLPTEAEWEYAARGNLKQKRYAWGDELLIDGKHQCNIWQGVFPDKNTARNGYIGTTPVHAYTPNGFGLYNVCGNVWEWCADWFSRAYHIESSTFNPTGPAVGQAKSMRGGSYLCHNSYCNRYRVAARSSNSPDSSSGNIGFRCAADVVN